MLSTILQLERSRYTESDIFTMTYSVLNTILKFGSEDPKIRRASGSTTLAFGKKQIGREDREVRG